jgi:hypothetical protein
MAHARQRVEWGRAASIIAKIHNVNCTKDRDTLPPSAFMPSTMAGRTAKKKAPPPTVEERELLRRAFPGKKG